MRFLELDHQMTAHDSDIETSRLSNLKAGFFFAVRNKFKKAIHGKQRISMPAADLKFLAPIGYPGHDYDSEACLCASGAFHRDKPLTAQL
jgi:hypothetical protein